MGKVKYDDGYWMALEEMRKANTPEELRAVHKKLKKYGDGIYFCDRYPRAHIKAAWASIWISLASIAISAFVIITRMAGG